MRKHRHDGASWRGRELGTRCTMAPASRSLLFTVFCVLAVLTIGVPFLLTELFLASGPATAATASGRRRRNNGTSARQPSEALATRSRSVRAPRNDTVRTLLSHGPAHAAIDLVFLSEAYEASMREAFFADAERIVAEHFAQPEAPFVGLLPLFNFHAVFVPSAAGRIPHSEVEGGPAPPRRTAFGVYREGGHLRAIVPSEGTEAQVVATCERLLGCTRCDFPVLLVNEPWYGGLSGEQVTLITNSRTSGAIAARHELAL